jgi:hypothetical protein
MKIIRKFLKLTKRTYPHGTERLLESHLPKGYQMDKHGNYFIQIGEPNSTMFTCHLDTASREESKVTHVVEGNYIKTDGTSILGADDKAGMTVLLYMIENKVHGLYYFFIGEERGCVGSSRLSKEFPEELTRIKKVISFDRRGTDSIITEQLYGRTCSDAFALDLSNKLNSLKYGFKFSPDPTGIYTDSAQFSDLVPECTNISVGYMNEHTTREEQNISHLVNLCKACCEIDWESLVVSRDPKEWSYDSHSQFDDFAYWGGGGGYSPEFDDEDDEDLDGWFAAQQSVANADFDEAYFDNPIYLNVDGNGLKKYYISEKRIEYEKSLILKELKSQGYYPTKLIWDGKSCWIEEGSKNMIYVGSRDEMSQFIVELVEIPEQFLIPSGKKKKRFA